MLSDLVAVFSVAHNVEHPATSMHVIMHQHSSLINRHHRWLLMTTSSPVQTVLIGDTNKPFTSPLSNCQRNMSLSKNFDAVHSAIQMVTRYEYFIVLEVFSQRCVFVKECIVTHHSREMQYKWSSLVMKESVHHEKHGLILHNFPACFCSGYKLFSCEANQQIQANLIFTCWFLYMWTSYSVISQITEDTDTEQSKEMLCLNSHCVF